MTVGTRKEMCRTVLAVVLSLHTWCQPSPVQEGGTGNGGWFLQSLLSTRPHMPYLARLRRPHILTSVNNVRGNDGDTDRACKHLDGRSFENGYRDYLGSAEPVSSDGF